MEEIELLCEKLEDMTLMPYDSFPDIDLYMDQVLGYIARKPGSFRADDKLTSAMVNNYVKAGILPRANGKKYTHEHLVYLLIISRLKQVLSVKDTGAVMSAGKGEKSDRDFYNGFDELIRESVGSIAEKLTSSGEDLASAALRLAAESYICKAACEYIIDCLDEKNPPAEKKQKAPKQEHGTKRPGGKDNEN